MGFGLRWRLSVLEVRGIPAAAFELETGSGELFFVTFLSTGWAGDEYRIADFL